MKARSSKLKTGLMFATGSLMLASPLSYAGWAMSASYGTSDYQYDFVLNDPEGSELFSQTTQGDYGYLDLTLDYSWGNHQVGVKHAMQLKESGIVDESSTYDLNDAFPGLAYDYSTTGSGERSETSLFYTYRFGEGWAWTTGYYTSDFEVLKSTEYSWNQVGLDVGLTNDLFPSDNQTETVNNEGYFTGLGYGTSFGGGWGGFARLGYQVAEVENPFSSIRSYEDGSTYEDLFFVESDGSATVWGVGIFYALSSDWVVTLQYDAKSYSYDDAQPVNIQDGVSVDTSGYTAKLDESQNSIYLTLRYVP